MYGFSNQAEKDAYKAWIKKGEKNAMVCVSLNADALASLWAALGASNQTEAMELCANFDKLKNERDFLRDQLTGAQLRINSLVGEVDALRRRQADDNAAFNKLSDAKSQVMAALSNSERECNRLSAKLEASKKMGAYYLNQWKRVENVIQDKGPEHHGGTLKDLQMQGRALRPMPAEAPEIKDFAGFANKENFGGSGPAIVNKVPSPLEIETKKFVDAIQKLFNIS